MGCPIINHPFWGIPIHGQPHICIHIYTMCVYRHIMYIIYIYIYVYCIYNHSIHIMIGYGWLSPCYIHNIYIYFHIPCHYIWLVKNSYVPLVQYIRAHPHIPFHSYNSLRSCRSYGSSHGQFTCNRCASSLHISYVHIISLFYDI